jgi:putative transposase
MARYSAERKKSILKKMFPPHNITMAEIARQEHRSLNTLYNWRNTAKQNGMPGPGKKLSSDDWMADAKLLVIIQTAALSAS